MRKLLRNILCLKATAKFLLHVLLISLAFSESATVKKTNDCNRTHLECFNSKLVGDKVINDRNDVVTAW